VVKRNWQHVMDEIVKTKQGPTQERWQRAVKDKALEAIRPLTLIETQAEHLLGVLERGTVSTNVHLRKLYNFALDMNWLPRIIIPKRQWPRIQFKEKRSITLAEFQSIIAREMNSERKAFYQLCWHLGGGQGDIASLKAEDADWEAKTISFFRRKTGAPVIIHLGREVSDILKDLPSEGPLFPYLCRVRASDRATEFKQRCQSLGIEGVTLHSFRYAWAERARIAG
jgi:integrase